MVSAGAAIQNETASFLWRKHATQICNDLNASSSEQFWSERFHSSFSTANVAP